MRMIVASRQPKGIGHIPLPLVRQEHSDDPALMENTSSLIQLSFFYFSSVKKT